MQCNTSGYCDSGLEMNKNLRVPLTRNPSHDVQIISSVNFCLEVRRANLTHLNSVLRFISSGFKDLYQQIIHIACFIAIDVFKCVIIDVIMLINMDIVISVAKGNPWLL